jgi:hypothetical protein
MESKQGHRGDQVSYFLDHPLDNISEIACYCSVSLSLSLSSSFPLCFLNTWGLGIRIPQGVDKKHTLSGSLLTDRAMPVHLYVISLVRSTGKIIQTSVAVMNIQIHGRTY